MQRLPVAGAAPACLLIPASAQAQGAPPSSLDSGAVTIDAEQDGAEFTDMSLSSVGVFASVGYATSGRVQPVFRFARLLPPGDDNDTTSCSGA